MNLVAADVSPLHLKSTGSQSRLTRLRMATPRQASAATVQGFNARIFREILTPALSRREREKHSEVGGWRLMIADKVS